MDDSFKRIDCRKIICDLFDASKKKNIINVYCECSEWWNLLQRTWCKINQYNIKGMKENPSGFIAINMWVHFKAIIMEPLAIKSNCFKMYYAWICQPEFDINAWYEYTIAKLKVSANLNGKDCCTIWKNHPAENRDNFIHSWTRWFDSTSTTNNFMNVNERKKKHRIPDYFLISDLPNERKQFTEKNMNQL